jgi:hypothetical protein
MSKHSLTPIVIGVGDIKNRSVELSDALEPLDLILQSIAHALEDTDLSDSAITELRNQIDSIDVVRTWTWPYPDLPGLLAERLGVTNSLRHKHYSEHGGNQPAKLFDEAARRIAKGESKVAIVTGGEALASCEYFSPFCSIYYQLSQDIIREMMLTS